MSGVSSAGRSSGSSGVGRTGGMSGASGAGGTGDREARKMTIEEIIREMEENTVSEFLLDGDGQPAIHAIVHNTNFGK